MQINSSIVLQNGYNAISAQATKLRSLSTLPKIIRDQKNLRKNKGWETAPSP